jgi:glycosyltransferase involved in cell wall biosynthesis
MDEILVSIDCITYNHEKYIADAIESFLMQKTNFKYEILVHDDASTDRTADIIKEYEKKYPDIIKPILQKENQHSRGIKRIAYVFNHNRAIGKYIAMCEGDDYWTDPYKLQKQIDYMESHPQCGMCFHAAEIVSVGAGKVGVIKPYDNNCISPTEDIILGGGGFIATNSIMYRKEILDNVPGFFLDAPLADYPLQILSSTRNYAYYISDFMSVYRAGVEGSWTSNTWANGLKSGKNTEEKVINLRKSLIEMLKEFDGYSSGRYYNTINKRILAYEFEILKVEKKIKQLKMPKYRPMYDSLSKIEKVKLNIKCYFPGIYRMCKILRFIIRQNYNILSEKA